MLLLIKSCFSIKHFFTLRVLEMGTTLLPKTNYSIDDTKSVVSEAFENQIDFVHSRFIKFDSECKEFETKYKMKSELFLTKFESGELGDDLQWFDWYAAFRGRKLWGKKYSVLSEISWSE